MLALKRRNDEGVIIDGADGLERLIKVTVVEIDLQVVRPGFEADKDITVHRKKVWERLAQRPKETHRAAYDPLDQWADDGGAQRSALSMFPTRARVAEEQSVHGRSGHHDEDRCNL